MNRQLELKDIAGSLQYDLHATDGVYIKRVSVECWDGVYNASEVNGENIKPILRPESDLYHPITQKGYNNDQPFVPILVLANLGIEKDWVINEEGSVVDKYNYKFIFEDGVFYTTDGYYDNVIYEQHQLFDLLNYWKIDYRGLISAGLAVSTQTLQVNPYEK